MSLQPLSTSCLASARISSGQNVNSYGKDLGSDVDFAYLIRMINDIPGDFLIRFMTSHPNDATEKLFKTMAECS